MDFGLKIQNLKFKKGYRLRQFIRETNLKSNTLGVKAKTFCKNQFFTVDPKGLAAGYRQGRKKKKVMLN
nr:hypothetical protein [Nostoc sp. EkiNYC01]